MIHSLLVSNPGGVGGSENIQVDIEPGNPDKFQSYAEVVEWLRQNGRRVLDASAKNKIEPPVTAGGGVSMPPGFGTTYQGGGGAVPGGRVEPIVDTYTRPVNLWTVAILAGLALLLIRK